MKLNVPELALYPLTAFGLASLHFTERRYWSILLPFLVFSLCCTTLSITLDDIMGYLDGVDQMGKLDQKKNIAKPLLTGELTIGEAKTAAGAIMAMAALLITYLASMAQQHSLAIFLLVALIAGVIQYSFGLKLSYRGMGELVILFGAAMTTALPFWILTGELPARVLFTALLAGVPYAAQIVISNAVDYATDKAGRRHTLTVLLGPERAPWLSAVFLALFWALFVVGIARGILPRAALLWLVLLPNHLRFLRLAFEGQSATARLLSFRTIRIQLALFPLSFILANHVHALG